ncbi:unnamed protein product [Didymodactylos carnosus]|uniref:Uncharacterized protein n=1 Tax=Didymodactylos carnosus TaxID=1234261 RepID=A0A8S2N3P5_9BILA|nr:unnamed protein product [Didymodactylos carnosus]CAF3978814.1 unnamed protein product [Didymodactylos carnosus]
MRDIIAVAPRIMRDSGPGMPNYVNMEDMKTGLGIGCTFAIILMIFSCVCFGIELHAYITYVPPPKRATPPPASPPPASPPPASPPARRVSPAIVLPPPSYDDAMRVPDYIPRRPAHPARSRSFVGPYGDPHRSYMGDRPSYERRDGPGLTRVETEPYVTVKTTGVHITNPRSTTRHTLLVAPSTCPRSICKEFLESLGLSPQYFTRSHDECYCTRCYPPSRTKIKSKGGYEYTVPVGWVRFSLHIDSALSKSKKIFQRWATSYYGTSADKLEPILRYGNGSIPFPNDQMPSGETFGTHLKDKDHLYTSPSINYAGQPTFSPIRRFRATNGELCDMQVVLQCKQKSDGPAGPTFSVHRGFQSDLCDVISNDVIEWKSSNRATVIPYNLLIRMV